MTICFGFSGFADNVNNVVNAATSVKKLSECWIYFRRQADTEFYFSYLYNHRIYVSETLINLKYFIML